MTRPDDRTLEHPARQEPTDTRTGPARRWWTVAAVAEVGLAAVVVCADLLIPSLVLSLLAVASLALRRRGPSTLGLRRPARPWQLAARMLGVAVVWTLVNLAVLIPVANHVSGQRQDLSAFADLQGNAALLAAYLAAAWVLAAFCEEWAFRGYLLTRLTDVLGASGAGRVVGIAVSAALFGSLHTEQGLVGVALSTAGGVVYAILRFRCGTLWAPVLVHGFVDTIGFVAFFAVGPVYGLW